MLPYRIVATDLDGTIVRSDGTIGDRTRAALAMVEEAGAIVVFVTGRPPRWMHDIALATGHRGLAICCNGAVVYDLHDESIVERHPLEPAVLQVVAKALRAELPDVAFAVEAGDDFFREASYVSNFDPGPETVREADSLFAAPAVKLLARHPTMHPDELLRLARHIVGEDATLVHSSRDGLLEISAPGVTKASALASFAASRGVESAGVIAFGDMPNDVPMVTWAGHGVAMANAHPDVLAVADEVAPSNNDEGVAVVLDRVFA